MNARDLASRLNLRRHPRSWRGNCPVCSYHDAFSVKPRRDGSALLYCCNGCGPADLAAEVARLSGGGAVQHRPDDGANKPDPQRKTADALRIWNGAGPALGTPADIYLTSRGLPGVAASRALRFRLDCRHPETRGLSPALLALVLDAAGEPLAVHRTYLTRDGQTANVVPVKASKGPVWGGAIRLDPVAAERVIGEGIETSASAGRLLGLSAWAAVSAGNLAAGLVLPPEVRSVVIAADADEPGERAAREAALRWAREGRRVRIARPDQPGKDFNDVLCERETVHA